MDRDEVRAIGLVPTIDQQRDTRPRLTAWAAATLAAALGCIVVSLIRTTDIDLMALAALAVILVVAEHRDRLFGDGTSVSGSIVVSLAAVVVFRRGPWLAAPMACSSAAGLYWPHLRNRALSRIAINAGSMSLAAGAAACTFHLLAPAGESLDSGFAIAGVAALSAFWLVNSMVLAVAVALIQRRRWIKVTVELVRSDTALLPLALCGLVCGHLINGRTAWTGWIGLIATLLAADFLVLRPGYGEVKKRVFEVAACICALSLSILGAVSGLSVSPELLLPVGLAAFGAALLHRRPATAHLLALDCAIAGALLLGGVVPIFSASAVCAVVLASDVLAKRVRSLLSTGSAYALAALAIGATGSVGTSVFGSSIEALLTIGIAGGVAALLAWNLVTGLSLSFDVGREAWHTVLDLIRTDLRGAALAGAVGSICGWLGREHGAGALAGSLAVTATVLAIGAAWSPSPRPTSILDDDHVVHDVVRSALLDLPASKLPSDL